MSISRHLLLAVKILAIVAITAFLFVEGLADSQIRVAEAQDVMGDRAALVALYNSTAGDNWSNNTNWNSNEPLGDWHGVTTDNNGRVTRVNIRQNNLRGTIPSELGNLSSLTGLYLGRNLLSGTIPSELGNLSNLNALDLEGAFTLEVEKVSGLTGSIPPELGNLSKLQEQLDLSRNKLTGSIPPELGNLTRLENLWIQDNQLTGTIPANLGNMSSLEQLWIQDNQLTGTIPANLGSLSSLTQMRMHINALSGQLPYRFTGLSALELLYFSTNAGLCAPLDSDFQAWIQNLDDRGDGDNCPPTTIQSGTATPVVGEPVTVRLTSREAYLARIQATLEEHTNDSCIGYDTSGDRASITIPTWTWERADADSNNNLAPDDSTWASVTAGQHPNASYIYLPQSGDVGKFLRASLTYGNPSTTVTTAAIGPIEASNGVASGDIVAANAPTGTLQVGNTLNVSLPDAANAERSNGAINPHPERWQWERSDDGSSGWTNVTPYDNCGSPDSEYPLTSEDEGKHQRAYVYYNDDSSGSSVLKRGEAAAVGPVAAE